MNITLDQMIVGQKGKIIKVTGDSRVKKAILEMGVLPGEEIEVIRVAPLGDPVDFLIKNYQLSLRKRTAAQVTVETEEIKQEIIK